MNISKCSVAAALLAVSTAGAAELVIAEYDIHDHPGGAQLPPAYALLLGDVFGSYNATFSAEVYNNTRLTILQDDVTNEFFMEISGTLFGGEDGGTEWVDPFDLEVNFRYGANVSAIADGWQVDGFSTLNIGSFTRLDTNETTTWYGKTDDAGMNGPAGVSMTFASDGWRVDGDDSSWVGRGWFTQNADGTLSHTGSQDWLFTATLVPAPTGTALLGLGGLAAMRRRR